MARYHLNPATGEPKPCRAKTKCPYGDLSADHWSTPTEAREAYERRAADETLATSKEALAKLAAERKSIQAEKKQIDKRVMQVAERDTKVKKSLAGIKETLSLKTATDEQKAVLVALRLDLTKQHNAAMKEVGALSKQSQELNARVRDIDDRLWVGKGNAPRSMTSGASYTGKK